MQAIREQSEQERNARLHDAAIAALVPHFEQRARESFFASLENPRALPHTPTKEEQIAENKRALAFFQGI